MACPNCGAPQASGLVAGSMVRCQYCQVEFKVGAPPAKLAPARRSSPARLVVVTALIVSALGVALWLRAAGPAALGATERQARAAAGTEAAAVNVELGSVTGAGEAAPAVQVVTPAPALREKAVVPATAEFTFHRTRAGYQKSVYVLGEVKNTSPFPIAKPEVISVMLDAKGQELGTDSGYGARDYMMPGETAYVSALIQDAPAFKSLRFEVVARRASYRPKFAEGLELQPAETKVKNGRYTFSGKVKNKGSTRARFLSVQVVGLDAEGKMLGLTQTYAKTDGLAPGASARYATLPVAYDSPPAKFATSVTGRVVDP